MRAFVKRNEFFWKYDFGRKRIWPKTYTAQWTSNASIAQQAQILEGQWRYEGNGVRPLTTGFDRALLIGDTGWTELRRQVAVHDPLVQPDHAAGLRGRPRGRLAGPQRLGPAAQRPPGRRPVPLREAARRRRSSSRSATAPVRSTTRRSPARRPRSRPACSIRCASASRAASRPARTRYSCKVWRADQAEPAAWDLRDGHPGLARHDRAALRLGRPPRPRGRRDVRQRHGHTARAADAADEGRVREPARVRRAPAGRLDRDRGPARSRGAWPSATT